MAKKRYSIVIEISSAYLKIVILDATNDKLLSAVVEDLSSLKIKEKRREFIIGIFKKTFSAYPLRHAAVTLCLSNDSIQIKRVELPHMPIKEIPKALSWKIKSMVPFDIDKAVLDFDILGEVQDEDGTKKFNLIAAVIPREGIDEKIALLKEAGLDVISGVNIDSFGLSNVIGLMPEGKEDATCAVLKVDYAKSTVNIYKSGQLVFVRDIPVGLNHITESIKGPLVSDRGMVELTFEDIAELKGIGIPDNKDILLDGKLEGKHLLVLLRPVVENLCSEVNLSFDYYNAQLEGKKISKLYLVGDVFKYKNLDKFIKETLDIETEHLKMSSSFFDTAVQLEADLKEVMPQIMPLIGIGRGSPTAKMDLLPVEYKIEKRQEIEKISIRMIGFTTLAILLISFILVNVRVNDYKNRLVSAKNHMKILQDMKILYDKITQREKLMDMVRSKEISSIAIMKELSNIVPSNMVLYKLVIDQKANLISLKGVLYLSPSVSEVILTNFMENLENSPFFKDVNLESSEKGVVDNNKVAIFNINCAIQR